MNDKSKPPEWIQTALEIVCTCVEEAFPGLTLRIIEPGASGMGWLGSIFPTPVEVHEEEGAGTFGEPILHINQALIALSEAGYQVDAVAADAESVYFDIASLRGDTTKACIIDYLFVAPVDEPVGGFICQHGHFHPVSEEVDAKSAHQHLN